MKMQLPAIGGIRKVLKTQPSTATTIVGLENTTLTIAQLSALLGIGTTAAPPNTQSTNPSEFLSVEGPGLSGGGPILGTVRVLFTPPFVEPDDPADPLMIPGPSGAAGAPGAQGAPAVPIWFESDNEDHISIPGPAGAAGSAGAAGVAGASGPALWFAADEPEDHISIPGPAGATGGPGAAGVAGPAGPALWFAADEPEDHISIPGPAGATGATGATGAAGTAGWYARDNEDSEDMCWRDVPMNCDSNIWSALQTFGAGIDMTGSVVELIASTPNSEFFIGNNDTGSGTGSLWFQAGSGSAAFGGGFIGWAASNAVSNGGCALSAVVGADIYFGSGYTPSAFGTSWLTLALGGGVFAGGIGLHGTAVPARVTGFGTPTGPGVVANFSGTAATTAQIQETIAEILTILKGVGLIGA
jgi:hypothetical protein